MLDSPADRNVVPIEPELRLRSAKRIREQIQPLIPVAKEVRQHFLAYLLYMAEEEASRIIASQKPVDTARRQRDDAEK